MSDEPGGRTKNPPVHPRRVSSGRRRRRSRSDRGAGKLILGAASGGRMRAVAVRSLGGVPELMDLPEPSPGAGEVLVHVGAAGVNPFDWKILEGRAETERPHVFPVIAGVDGAGTVTAVGTGVTRFKVGDAIYGQFLHTPVGIGTYAEFAVAPESIGLATIPRGMTVPQAAAVPTAGMTGLRALDVLGLSRGAALLIQGAAGGIGSYVTQFAAAAGIRAFTTSRGPHREYLQQLGSYRFFDAGSRSMADEIRGACPGGVDAVLDLYESGAELMATARLVRPGGTVASTIGGADVAALRAEGLTGVNVDLDPSAALLERVGKEFSEGRLRIPVEQVLPLSEGPRILAESKAGRLRGKTVLTP